MTMFLRRFFKDSTIYAIPIILSRGIGFFLLPIYTHYLSPTDYGMIELLAISYALLNLILPLEVNQAVARFLPEMTVRQQKIAYAATAFWFTGIVFTIVVLFSWIYPRELGYFLLGSPEFVDLVRFASIAMLANALVYVIQSQLRWNLQSMASSMVNMSFAIGMAVISVLLIVFLNFGVLGYIIGQLAGSIVALIIGLFLARRTVPILWMFDRKKLHEMLVFSAPLVLSSIAVYISLYMDRWMLRFWLGLDDVGIYSVAYRVASIVGLVMIAFQMALVPLIYNHYKEPETPIFIGKLFKYFLSLVLPLIAFTGMFSKEIISILSGPSFQDASQLVAWLSLAVIFMSIYVFAPGLTLAKKTKKIALVNVIAATVNICLNALWIPLFGSMGAAIATLLGGLVMASLYFKWGQREYTIPYQFMRYAVALLWLLSFIVITTIISIPLSLRVILWILCSGLTTLTLLEYDDWYWLSSQWSILINRVI